MSNVVGTECCTRRKTKRLLNVSLHSINLKYTRYDHCASRCWDKHFDVCLLFISYTSFIFVWCICLLVVFFSKGGSGGDFKEDTPAVNKESVFPDTASLRAYWSFSLQDYGCTQVWAIYLNVSLTKSHITLHCLWYNGDDSCVTRHLYPFFFSR